MSKSRLEELKAKAEEARKARELKEQKQTYVEQLGSEETALQRRIIELSDTNLSTLQNQVERLNVRRTGSNDKDVTVKF